MVVVMLLNIFVIGFFILEWRVINNEVLLILLFSFILYVYNNIGNFMNSNKVDVFK